METVDPPETQTETEDRPYTLLQGDCREVLRGLPAESVDAIVTDPPYGLSAEPDAAEVLRHWLSGDTYTHTGGGFMGKTWDAFVPGPDYWRECLRVLKPGGHLLAFGGTRTADLLGIALRLAGFSLRDTLYWVHGQGFPKSLDVGKAIDKAAGAQREVVRSRITPHTTAAKGFSNELDERPWMTAARERGYHEHAGPTPATDAARQWDGWGTALKPAVEPILLARKPLAEGTVAANVLAHGTGALNIGACRVGMMTPQEIARSDKSTRGMFGLGSIDWKRSGKEPTGRWPAHLLLGHAPGCVPGGTCAEGCPVVEIDRQSGVSSSRATGYDWAESNNDNPAHVVHNIKSGVHFGDSGGASRYFAQFHPDPDPDPLSDLVPFLYAAKASRGEREAGLPEGVRNTHPTVKPVSALQWLVRLTCPPGGVVLDPFNGSGTTGVAALREGMRYLGVDLDTDGEYLPISQARLAHELARRSGVGGGVGLGSRGGLGTATAGPASLVLPFSTVTAETETATGTETTPPVVRVSPPTPRPVRRTKKAAQVLPDGYTQASLL